MAVNCVLCNKSFGSSRALEQHQQNAPAHVFACTPCDRRFNSSGALQQHLQYSPAHLPSFDCGDCNRSFNSEEALKQHTRDSPAHASSFYCDDCNRSFTSDEALQQHIRDSPAHAPSFHCEACIRSFGSKQALEQHVRDSRGHQKPPRSPLDTFFLSFRTFEYDPAQPPATSYAQLQEHEGWRRGDAASNEAWNRYQEALEDELRMWYGEEDSLAAWHVLCRAIGVKPLPQTCKRCAEAVRRTHVNIIDLIEWGRRCGDTDERVRTFPTVGELRHYTKETRKIFRNTLDEEDGNVVLRHLLRRIF